MFVFAFVLGFFSAIFCMTFAVAYTYFYARNIITTRLLSIIETSKCRNKALKKEMEGTTEFDSVKIVSKVKFAVTNLGTGIPRCGRIVLVGSTISLYETVLIQTNYNKCIKPYYSVVSIEEEAEYMKGNASTRSGRINAKKDNKGGSNNQSNNSYDFPTPAGYTVGERLVGNISTSNICCKSFSMAEKECNKSDKYCPFFGTGVLAKFSKFETIIEGGLKGKKYEVRNQNIPLFVSSSTATEDRSHIKVVDGNDMITASYIDDNPSRWCSMVVKFATQRDAERWVNILNPNDATHQWRSFVSSLPPPSIDVINIVAARLFFENREGDAIKDILTKKINRKLSKVVIPKPISGTIKVYDVSPGPELPLLTNISQIQCSTCGEIEFDLDMTYRGGFDLQLELDLTIGKSRKVPKLVVRIRINEVSGRLHISVGPPPSNRIWLGFHNPPNIDLTFKGQAASEKPGLFGVVIGLIPDLSSIITNIVRTVLLEDMTLPSLDDFPLPNVMDTPPISPLSPGNDIGPNVYNRCVSGGRDSSNDHGDDVKSNESHYQSGLSSVIKRTAAAYVLSNTSGKKPTNTLDTGRYKTPAQAPLVPKTLLHGNAREFSGGSE